MKRFVFYSYGALSNMHFMMPVAQDMVSMSPSISHGELIVEHISNETALFIKKRIPFIEQGKLFVFD